MNLRTVLICLGILLVHWFADFVMQTDKEAKGKSKNWEDLIIHTLKYSVVWFGVIFLYGIITGVFYPGHGTVLILFTPITFICHTATDYYTSRVNSQLWEKGETHAFFVSIGFDQLLHFIQLFLTFYLLS